LVVRLGSSAASGPSHLEEEDDMIARVAVAFVLLSVGGFCIGDDKKDNKKDDKELLQGEWPLVSIELGGKEVERSKDQKLVIKGDDWTAPGGGKFKFKIDATKSPKQLDLIREQGGQEFTWVGIYKIEGDTLTFCRSAGAGGERPKEFKGGPGVALLVFKRAEKK
jgi:uncharacterized protein (TIGR03067 family)